MEKISLKQDKSHRLYPYAIMQNHTTDLYLSNRAEIYYSTVQAYIDGLASLSSLNHLLLTILRGNYTSNMISHHIGRHHFTHTGSHHYSTFEELKESLKYGSSLFFINVKSKEEKDLISGLIPENVFININPDAAYSKDFLITLVKDEYAQLCFNAYDNNKKMKKLYETNVLSLSYGKYNKNKLSVFSLDILSFICYNYIVKEIDLCGCSIEDAMVIVDIYEWHMSKENGFYLPDIICDNEDIKSLFISSHDMYKLAFKI